MKPRYTYESNIVIQNLFYKDEEMENKKQRLRDMVMNKHEKHNIRFLSISTQDRDIELVKLHEMIDYMKMLSYNKITFRSLQ